MAVGEFELIRRYFDRGFTSSSVSLGVGDDCALLRVPENRELAVSVDTLVAGVHFPENGDPQKIAHRALSVSLSDLAAMSADPHWFTLCITLPDADENWLAGFSKGLFEAATQYDCELVGGDTTRGPLSLSLQVMGSVPSDLALRRSGACVGDSLFVTGTVGDGAAALAAMLRKVKVSHEAYGYLMQRYYQPRPCFKEAQALRGIASSAIDVSDGLAQDLSHICVASQVGAIIDLPALPISSAVEACGTTSQQREWALHGGDDYQLCFTVPPENLVKLEKCIDRGLKATHIGEIIAEQQLMGRTQGKLYPLKKSGYQHFG